MKKFERFFCYCSGASLSILKRCPTEISKFVGVGATVFFTGLLAAISSAYALFFVFDGLVLSIGFGIIWGLMIFNLDRFIVLSMRKSHHGKGEYFQALPRLVLAILIAIVISKPLELKIFEKEIATELSLIEQEVKLENERSISMRYASQLDSLNKERKTIAEAIAKQQDKRDELLDLARQEADGTGGSGKVNPGPIYLIKKKNADQAEDELEALKKVSQKKTKNIEDKISTLLDLKQQEMDSLVISDLNGISFQLTALDRLGEKYPTIFYANLFIILLFITLEISPILSKLIAPRGPYDDLLEVHEKAFESYRKEKKYATNKRFENLVINQS
ncbi:MAG: DUF4407 domain-containing protein [Reichenbachiella sp.]|uniref:DUF4407 domain-containing protein n=1 Tax=Reichenbachiella sp. TaxID=2184521 RepID=UPI00326612F2